MQAIELSAMGKVTEASQSDRNPGCLGFLEGDRQSIIHKCLDLKVENGECCGGFKRLTVLSH